MKIIETHVESLQVVPLPVAVSLLMLVGLLLSGCTGRKSEKVEDKPPPTQLEFELPVGVEVLVDRKEIGRAPLAATDVTPGSHEVKMTTACATATVNITTSEGGTTTIDLGQAPELKFAKLRVEARNLEATPLQPTLRLGEVELGAGSVFDVPACKHRVTIAATQDKGLGAFIEDIEFEPGQSYERKVVLAPGPDMVRIHGGKFVIGPPEAKAEAWGFIDRYRSRSRPSTSTEPKSPSRSTSSVATTAAARRIRKNGGRQSGLFPRVNIFATLRRRSASTRSGS